MKQTKKSGIPRWVGNKARQSSKLSDTHQENSTLFCPHESSSLNCAPVVSRSVDVAPPYQLVCFVIVVKIIFIYIK